MNSQTQYSILIIDDNPANLKLLHELLSCNGYRVRAANTPKLGISSAKKTPPDLILLDIAMPEMDGYDVCQIFKKDPQTEPIPVIFISASDGAFNKVKAFDVGGVDYISKPFDATEVLARIESHLQLSVLQKQTQESLITSQNMLEAIMDNSPAIIYIKSIDGQFLQINKEFERVTGFKARDIIGKTGDSIFSPNSAKQFTKNDNEVISESQYGTFEETLELDSGNLTFLSLKFLLKDANGNDFAICGISTDISKRKQAEAELQHLATYDTLTDLPNRALFMSILAQHLALLNSTDSKHAILIIDLDNFKNINDSLGHETGDILLEEVARRLQKCVREGDTVSRMGGDEFIILLQNIQSPTEAADVSEKIIRELAPEFSINERLAFITPSIGIVITPDNGQDEHTLLRNVDTAMNQAKKHGRNTYQFFTDKMNKNVLVRMEIEKELRIALHKGEINPYYQPKIDTKTGKVCGFEALSRWHHPTMGQVSPAIFIPIAEESNLIIALDRHILKTSIEKFGPLIKNGSFTGTISVNLTAQHFFRHQLLEFIDGLLCEYDFPAHHLDLEITEGTVIEDVDTAIKLMEELHERGIQLSIDDFGTGYSSLSYLKRFPVKSLKIDISFIRDLTKSESDKNLVASIINLAQGLKLECVAEGVETIEQADILYSLNCDTLQGFLFSQAIDFNTISETKVLEEKFTTHLDSTSQDNK